MASGNNSIQVTTTQMKRQVEQLRSDNSRLKQKIADLRSQEISLSRMWDGEANDAFHNAFTSDAQQMDNFYNTIQDYASKLEQIIANYEKAENANKNTAATRSYR